MKVILQQNSEFIEKPKTDKLTMEGDCKRVAMEATQKLWDEVEVKKASAKTAVEVVNNDEAEEITICDYDSDSEAIGNMRRKFWTWSWKQTANTRSMMMTMKKQRWPTALWMTWTKCFL
jgi:hypothetical protein